VGHETLSNINSTEGLHLTPNVLLSCTWIIVHVLVVVHHRFGGAESSEKFCASCVHDCVCSKSESCNVAAYCTELYD